MNIFGGRPGIAAGVLAVIAILVAAFCIYEVNIALLISAGVFVILCIILFACKYISGYRLFVNILVTAVFCAALLRGVDVFYNKAQTANDLCGKNMYVHATVTERKSGGDYYTNYIIRVHSVNGIECDLKAALTCEYNSDLQKGYEFVLRHAVIQYVPTLEESEAVDLISENIFLSVITSEPEDYAILSENNISWQDEFKSLNSYLSAKLRKEIKGDEGRLAAAMLLGDKSALTSEMYRDFSRSGLSHYLAVSGLHVSIITGLVSFFLMKLRLRRSVRNLLITFFALGYLCLLGFPISAVRAVLMLLTAFIAYSMGDLSDSVNALGIAAAVIILISPMSVFDKSFILSFCAALGIVSFMPLFNDLVNKLFNHKKKSGEESKAKIPMAILKKAASFVFGTLMSVAAALSLTLLPTAYLFGEISVLGFQSNLAAALIGMPLLASSLLYLFLGNIPYLGDGLTFIIRKSAGYLLDLSAELGDTRGALLSLTSNCARIVVCVFSILIFFLLVIRIRHKKLLLLAPLSYPLVILAITLITASTMPSSTELTFFSTEKDEVILAAYGGESAIIDISDGSLTRLNLASQYAHENGITEFDTLVLTHYHTRHLSSVSRFAAGEKLRRVLLPYPENEDDAWIMAQLINTLQASGVACEIIFPDSETALFGDTYLTLSRITRLERSDHPVIYLSVSEQEERVTYMTGSAWEASDDYVTRLERLINDSDTLIFGSHGPVIKSHFTLPININNTESCIIFDDDDISYILAPDDKFLDDVGLFIGAGVYKVTMNGASD